MITINFTSIKHNSLNEGAVAGNFRLKFSIGNSISNNIDVNLTIPDNANSRIITKEIPVGVIDNDSNLNGNLVLSIEPIRRMIGGLTSTSSFNKTSINNWQSGAPFEKSITISNGVKTSTIIVKGAVLTNRLNMALSSNFTT